MTFYQELQLNQAGSKSLMKNSKTMKEKLYHAFVYMVKIAVTMVFCFAFVTASSIILGKDNSIVGVVVLLCVMVFRNADLGIHTRHSTWLLALFFVIMTVCPHLANQLSPLPALLINIAALAVLILFGCHNPFMFNQSTLVLGYLLLYGYARGFSSRTDPSSAHSFRRVTEAQSPSWDLRSWRIFTAIRDLSRW